MMFNYFRFGGVRYDLPDGWVEQCRALMDPGAGLVRRVRGARRRQRRLPAALHRQGRHHPARTSLDYAITGPNARASGVAHDLRRTRPYSVYPELDFEVCLGEHGDVFDRYQVRVEEMRESAKIVLQCLDMLPGGRCSSAAARRRTSSRRRRAPLHRAGEPARRVRHLHRQRRVALPVPAQVPRPVLRQPADLPQAAARQQDRRRGGHLGQHGPRARRHRPLMHVFLAILRRASWRSSSPTRWCSWRRS